MKINFNYERSLQLFIILICIIILTIRFLPTNSCAQTPCPPDQPPLATTFVTPQKSAWQPGTNVTVVIFDRTNVDPTAPEEINAVSNSIRDWNNRGCSNVTFGVAQAIGTAWNGDTPPDNAMWVVRTTDRSGQLVRIGNNTLGMRRALLYMHSDYNLQTSSTHSRVDNLAKHEASHSFGMNNCTAGPGNNPIAVICENSFTTIPGGNYVITQCDEAGINRVYCPVTPTPTPTPTPEPIECDPSMPDYCQDVFCTDVDPNDCNRCATFVPGECASPQAGCNCSPILIDVDGDGFSLTNAENGVDFDLNGDGIFQSRLGWTTANNDDAWLALDRNGNDQIDNGLELFGNFTEQSDHPNVDRNGFQALAELDKEIHGGNSDGKISAQDTFFYSLRLWQDENHNGISEQDELKTLPESGVVSIDLDYKKSKRTDEYGNRFKYRAKVRDARGTKVNRWAWDVFLVSLPKNKSSMQYSLNSKFDRMQQWIRFTGMLEKRIFRKCKS